MPSDRLKNFTALLVLAFLMWGGSNLALDALARSVERRGTAYLWWQEEWLQTFQPSNYEGRGRTMVLLSGSSEAREAFLPEIFDRGLPGLHAYQNSLSVGSLSSFRVLLEYIDRTYGPSGFPRRIVLGICPRFLMENPELRWVPLIPAIDKYSPYWRVDLKRDPPELVPKTGLEPYLARFRFLTRQPRRYASAVHALLVAGITRVFPSLRDSPWLKIGLSAGKYHHLPPRKQARYWRHAREQRPHYRLEDKVVKIRSEFARILALLERHGSRLYVVNLPLAGWMEEHYTREFRDGCLAAVRSAIGRRPILDLEHLLPDDMFYDFVHPTYEGGLLVSREVVRFIRELEGRRDE